MLHMSEFPEAPTLRTVGTHTHNDTAPHSLMTYPTAHAASHTPAGSQPQSVPIFAGHVHLSRAHGFDRAPLRVVYHSP